MKQWKPLSMRKQFFIKNFFKNALLLLLPILLIGPYSILQLNIESKSALRKNSYNVLYQLDEIINTFLSEADNIYYYFRSNLSVNTSLKTAYSEPVLTKNSLRSINQICTLLRYYMYTNDYIQNIYVYYDNDNSRILIPERGMILTESYEDIEWIESAKNSSRDIWIEANMVKKNNYTEPVHVMKYYRKLYSTIDPSTQIGAVVVEYSMEALYHYLESIGLYENQMILVLDKENQILFQNQVIDIPYFFEKEESAKLGEQRYYDIVEGKEKYTISQMYSHYLKELTYISVVPTKDLMRSTNQFVKVFGMLIIGAILLSVILATLKTQNDYRRLEKILNVLSNPEFTAKEKRDEKGIFSNPYNYITYNIINLFLQQNYLKIKDSEQKYKLKELELTALQRQINPHFLHNALNTIYWEAIALTKGPNDCAEMITKVASIMRYSLGNPEENVTMQEELRYLENYIYIQSQRYKNKFCVEYDVDEEAMHSPIKKIILQPLVENAIYHGIKEKEGKGEIRIRIHFRETYIFISILDNGVGMDKMRVKELEKSLSGIQEYSQHVGLINSNRRLVLTYGEESQLHICSQKGRGTCVFFKLPVS